MINYISALIMPLVLLAVIVFGFAKKTPVFSSFRSGALQGLRDSGDILPTFIGMITAVTVMRASGALDALIGLFTPISDLINIPAEIMPIALTRPLTSGGALALLDELYATQGPDSFLGRLASVVEGANETTIYVFSLYFTTVQVKKTRQTLVCALFADLCALVFAGLFIKML